MSRATAVSCRAALSCPSRNAITYLPCCTPKPEYVGEQQAHSEQLQNALSQVLTDHAHTKAEHDALQTTRARATELLN